MAIFDQRGQHVMYQYNVNGTINFGAVQTPPELVTELKKLQGELAAAIEQGVFDEEKAADAEYQLKKAVQQAGKPEPDKKQLVEHLEEARKAIEGVTAAAGLVTALLKAVELVQKLF